MGGSFWGNPPLHLLSFGETGFSGNMSRLNIYTAAWS